MVKKMAQKTKKTLLCIFVSACLMLLLPFGTRYFTYGYDIPMFLLLSFIINPLTFIIVGISCGRTLHTSWFHPFIPAAFYLAGMWSAYSTFEFTFVMYALFYLSLSFAAAVLAHLVKEFLEKGLSPKN
ncbi:MAG: hypothetical protein J6I50_00125 [Clostridia bacterium]|nr:hypothetical protein [Clostridia bacterium]